MTPPSNGAFALDRNRRQLDATFHRERPFAHPHLRISETTEARQQGAGRHLHQGGCYRERLSLASLTDEEMIRVTAFIDGGKAGSAGGAATGAPLRRDIPRPRPPRRRPSSVVKTTWPRAARSPSRIPVASLPAREAAGRKEETRTRRGTACAGRADGVAAHGGRRPEEKEKEREAGQRPGTERQPSNSRRYPRRPDRRYGGSRRNRPRRSPTSSCLGTPFAPAKRAPSRFPSTSANMSSDGLPPNPLRRPRRTAKRRPSRCHPEAQRRAVGSVPAVLHAVASCLSLGVRRRGRQPLWAAASSGN